MNSLSSIVRSRTSLAIGVYLLVFASLGLLIHAQVRSMQLFQSGQPVSMQ